MKIIVNVTSSRGFTVTVNGVEYCTPVASLRRLADGAPFVRIGHHGYNSAPMGRGVKIGRELFDVEELKTMLREYPRWNRDEIAQQNRLAMYG